MIKLMFMMKRKDGTSLGEFKKWLLEEHVSFARKLPGLQKYTANPLVKEDPEALYDAITALYFESEAAIGDAFASDVGEAAGKNVAEHCETTSQMVCQEKPLI